MDNFRNPIFKKYFEEALGEQYTETLYRALDVSPSVSIRYNQFKNQSLIEGKKSIKWSDSNGWYLSERPKFIADPFFHAGQYYVQDSSSMFVGEVARALLKGQFKLGRQLKVLDLCAAPGGKTTDLALSLRKFCGDNFLLVSNEVMSKRAVVLSDNVAIWGDPNVVVTSVDPKAFAQYKDFFDIIVTDVPCSGEGMFRKEPEAVAAWSPDNVALCAARQKRIVADVWPALRKDGFLIYSTCTFNKYENDDNIEWISKNLGGEPFEMGMQLEYTSEGEIDARILKTEYGYSLVPGLVPGEGQYCGVVKKTDDVVEQGSEGDFSGSMLESVVDIDSNIEKKEIAERGNRSDKFERGEREQFRRSGRGRHNSKKDFLADKRGRFDIKGKGNLKKSGFSLHEDMIKKIKSYFNVEVTLHMIDDMLIAIPSNIKSEIDELSELKVLRKGVTVGNLKGKNLIPSADLALSIILNKDVFPQVELDREDALKFLHGDPIILENAPVGYILIQYKTYPLGFVKNIGRRCNNLHPKGRRIKKDVQDLLNC